MAMSNTSGGVKYHWYFGWDKRKDPRPYIYSNEKKVILGTVRMIFGELCVADSFDSIGFAFGDSRVLWTPIDQSIDKNTFRAKMFGVDLEPVSPASN